MSIVSGLRSFPNGNKFIADMKISNRLSRLEDKTAIDPEVNPAKSL